MSDESFGMITVLACKCSRCHHVWLPRKPGEIPVACAACKSAYWNKARQEKPPAKRKARKS